MKIDYELLKEQREALIYAELNKTLVPVDVLEGLINLCDNLLDKAEEEGLIKDTFLKVDKD